MSIRSVVTTKTIAFIALTISWIGCVTADDSGVLYGVRAANQKLTFRMLDLASLQPAQDKGSMALNAQERLAGIFQNPDRSVGVLRISTNSASSLKALVQMAGLPGVLVNASSSRVSGLTSAYAISSLSVPASGLPLALVAQYSDTPSYRLVNVDLTSGAVTPLAIKLNPMLRYAHLTQCPGGGLYALSLAPQSEVRLVRFDLDTLLVAKLALLQFSGQPMRQDVFDLACNAAGQVYALSDIKTPGSNSVFRVDVANGTMAWVRDFDVDRFVFVK